MKLIFEKSVPGRRCTILPACDVESVSLPASLRRETKPTLPEMSETDISRHYTELCKQVHGVNCGFYPLGSCTMKYNPRIDEEMAALPGFTGVHPLSPAEDRRGMRQVLDTAAQYLCEITGMNAMTFQPAAGAHGEFTGVLLTNPNTVGIFDKNILEITRLVHEAGGLCYYDGANLNAVMGVVRPGDMGFDCIHMNLHKTFATPHGGGGPGAGAVGCKAFLKEYLPHSALAEEPGHIQVRSFQGNFLVVVRALAYLLALGREGIPEAAENAVLNANYLLAKLKGTYTPAYDRLCMHEFVLDLSGLKKETGVSALDVAKSLIDEGIHPPTMYFPLIVHEALMLEPTETEGPETLDHAAEVLRKLYHKAFEDAEPMHTAPHNMPIGRPDEVQAARRPVLRWRNA